MNISPRRQLVKTLYIAEKPSLAKAIAEFLGGFTKDKTSFSNGDTKVTWCYGHVFATVEPDAYDEKYKKWVVSDLPIIPKEWILKPRADAKEQVNAIKDMLAWADEVIHAGDPDREGQLLVDEVLEYFNYTGPVKRVLINATDTTSMKRAFESIVDNAQFKSLSQAGLGRSQMDWLLGMSGTRLYTLRYQHIGGKGKLNVGRVQTPTLALVVNREHEITGFKQQTFYDIHAHISVDNESFSGKIIRDDYIVNKTEANELIDSLRNASQATIQEWDVKDKTEAPPLPYSLDTLQGQMNKKYGWSPKRTLEVTQKLYEAKYVSYPRSDCNYLPMGQYADAPDILDAIARGSGLPTAHTSGADTSLQSKCFNDSKVTAHHAIIPTREVPKSLNADEQQLYDEIALRYVLQWYPVMEFTETKYVFSIAEEQFSGRSVYIKSKGFKALVRNDSEDEDADDNPTESKTAVKANVGDYATIIDVLSKEGVTKPPKRFTEGTLLTAMSNIHRFVEDKAFKEKLKEIKGIGTPATRSSIIAGLIDNGFMQLDGKSLCPTALGEELIKHVPDTITKPDMTAKMELSLMEVEKGLPLKEVIDEYETFLRGLVDAEQSIFKSPPTLEGPECPVCHNGILRLIKGPKGAFWGCSHYTSGCKASFSDANGSPAIYPCPECGTGFMKTKKGAKGTFWGCSRYPECKHTAPDEKGKPKY